MTVEDIVRRPFLLQLNKHGPVVGSVEEQINALTNCELLTLISEAIEQRMPTLEDLSP